jgi:hypothetical protein
VSDFGKDLQDVLAAAMKTANDRSHQYQDSYWRHGAVMAALYPDGVRLETANDHTRFVILSMVVAKLVRYTVNPAGHQDSIHDTGVYAFILETIDKKLQQQPSGGATR